MSGLNKAHSCMSSSMIAVSWHFTLAKAGRNVYTIQC